MHFNAMHRINLSACLVMVTVMTLLPAMAGCQPTRKATTLTGADQMDLIVASAAGKQVGLFANHTATVGNKHLLDTMLSKGIKVTRIFSPEHGFRGDADAGETVAGGTDPRTGIQIVSLYGPSKKPSADQLAGLDIIFFDMQDIGARFFTYISSLHYMMEACARDGKKLIILDRPNPNGSYVDGPVMQPAFKSFVGMHPVPIVHGMTIGEYARMVNAEGWLEGGKRCDLEVIGVKYWKHSEPWHVAIKPSPNLPNDHAIALYPSTCLFEGTVLSIGRGTQSPFEQAGHPSLRGKFDHSFTPVSIPGMAKTPVLQDQLCFGIDFRKDPVRDHIDLDHLITLYQAFPDKEKFFNSYFDKLAGTAELKEQIRSGMPAAKIREGWKKDLEAFRKIRAKYLLYP